MRWWVLGLVGCAPFENPAPVDTGGAVGGTPGVEWVADERRVRDGTVEGAKLGGALAAVDGDGDGRAELVVGAPYDDARVEGEGRLWVLSGPDLQAEDTVVAAREQEKLRFGSSLTAVGDVDGDGYPDLAVGAVNDDTGGYRAGAVHLLWGGAAGLDAARVVVLPPTLPRDEGAYGRIVRPLGDLDGDGRADLGVADGAEDGAVEVWFGAAAPVVERFVPDGLTAGGGFGTGLVGGGDIDGDGQLDLVVGDALDLTRVFFGPYPWTRAAAPAELGVPDVSGRALRPGLLADLDGDGRADLATSSHAAVCAGTAAGIDPDCVAVGAPPETVVPMVAKAVLPVPERTGDGLPELLFAGGGERHPDLDQTGRVLLRASGPLATGAVLGEVRPAADSPSACFGNAVAAADGWLAVGDPCTAASQGAVHLLMDFSSTE